jgi:hypothetical protein
MAKEFKLLPIQYLEWERRDGYCALYTYTVEGGNSSKVDVAEILIFEDLD